MLHQRLRPRATHQFLIRTSAPNTVPKSSTPKTSPKICIPNFVPKSGAPKTVPKSCTLKSASKITKEMWWCLCTKDLHQRLHPRASIKKIKDISMKNPTLLYFIKKSLPSNGDNDVMLQPCILYFKGETSILCFVSRIIKNSNLMLLYLR